MFFATPSSESGVGFECPVLGPPGPGVSKEKRSMRAEQRWRRSSRFRWNFLLFVATMVTTVVAMTGLASAETQASYQGQVTSNTYSQSAGSGLTPPNTGTPIDPLRYDCATPSSGPSGCQNVGLTHGYYDNHVVNFL